MSGERVCGVLFPSRSAVDPEDCDGCELPNAHSGRHRFVAADGRRYEWETDLDCDCYDCQSDEPDDWCIVYTRIEGGR